MGKLAGFFKGVIQLVKSFKGKPKLTDVFTQVIIQLPALVNAAIDIWGANSKEKFDEFLLTLDTFTGTDEGALDLFKDIPADAEEKFWDAIKDAARVIGYNKLKVEGYYVPHD